MKRFSMILLALLVVAAGVLFSVSAADETFISPTAPTLPPVTIAPPTVPGVISTVPGTSTPATPGGTTAVPGTKAPSGTAGPREQLTSPYEQGSAATTPDGSTISGTAKPDANPNSPKTGDTSMEVFAFAGLALACTGVAIVLKKRKAEDVD